MRRSHCWRWETPGGVRASLIVDRIREAESENADKDSRKPLEALELVVDGRSGGDQTQRGGKETVL